MKIGNTLRESRINAKMSVKQISDILTEQGYKASEKTIYSWESDNSKPDIEILMKLCDLYGIRDILKTFGYNGYKEDGSIQLNMKEHEIIESYRSLTPSSKNHIDYELNREVKRMVELQKQSDYIKELEKSTQQDSQIHKLDMRLINYYYRLASAGTGQIVFDMPPTKRIEIPDIPEYRSVDYAIGVNGSSMEPEYSDGDTLLIEMAEEVTPGENGIFLVDGESYVKKLGDGELISLNPEYGNTPLTENSRCMGKVVGKL